MHIISSRGNHLRNDYSKLGNRSSISNLKKDKLNLNNNSFYCTILTLAGANLLSDVLELQHIQRTGSLWVVYEWFIVEVFYRSIWGNWRHWIVQGQSQECGPFLRPMFVLFCDLSSVWDAIKSHLIFEI